MSHFRSNIERMAAYVPGEQPQGPGFVKLNTNENPYPPSPKVIAAVRAAADEGMRLYPDPVCRKLRQKAAEVYGTRPDRVLAGNGSDDLLTIILRTFAGPRTRVAYPTPTYSLYATLCEIESATAREIPFPADFSLPQKLVSARAAVTFVANPNSPTGTVIPPKDLGRLARQIDGVLVVDEAYVDFAESDCLGLVNRHRNVVVLRTFSKSFSLCGARLGLAFGRKELLAGMWKVKDSYNVNRLAQAAGIAALGDIGAMRRTARKIVRTRVRLTKGLESLGWFVYPSQGNFVFARVRPPHTARECYQALKARKILVRYFDRPRLDDGLRISVGTDKEIDALLAALRGICAPKT